jgi:putative restriction endonuclease
MAAGKRWTSEELLVVINLYHKLTFGQMHARHPAIVAVAMRLGRTASSVAMKLCNFASLDPALKIRGIRGLTGASERDRLVWGEFHANLAEAAPASEEAFRNLFGVDENTAVEVMPADGIAICRRPPTGPTETATTRKVRRGQEYFRQAVLNNFGGKCGVTGLAIRELLIASHILPWGRNPTERLNIRNGLCLSRLHDAAFDARLIAFDSDYRLRLSARLMTATPDRAVREIFVAYEGEALRLAPDAVLPDDCFLADHYARVFSK